MELPMYNDLFGENTERSTAEELWAHDHWYTHDRSRHPSVYKQGDTEPPTAAFVLIASVQEKQQDQSDFLYSHSSMNWSDRDEDASGSSAIVPILIMRTDNNAVEDEQEALDRVILLAKKYASINVKLSKEDNARLEMINQKMDLKFPRYSSRDWDLLEEAKSLISKLTDISGVEI